MHRKILCFFAEVRLFNLTQKFPIRFFFAEETKKLRKRKLNSQTEFVLVEVDK